MDPHLNPAQNEGAHNQLFCPLTLDPGFHGIDPARITILDRTGLAKAGYDSQPSSFWTSFPHAAAKVPQSTSLATRHEPAESARFRSPVALLVFSSVLEKTKQ